MKKTLNLDATLLKDAREACGAKTDTDTIRLGLEALVRNAAYQRMRTFLGSERGGKFEDVPRRRERPARKRKIA